MFTFAFFIFIAFASMLSYYLAYEIKKGKEVEEEYRKAMLHQAQNLRAYKKELRMYGSRIDNALHELGELDIINEKEINPRGGQY
jgi:hypothetical protein